ncbi:membrane transport protein [Bordetella pertussis]|nr:membrane transport protein [Bordetella pertussis]
MPALIAFAAAWRHLAETPAARRDGALAGTLMRRPRTWLLIAAFGLVNGAIAQAAGDGLCRHGVLAGGGAAGLGALDHFSQAEPAGVLAALMQGGGFLIAGLAPFAVAALRAATGGWTMHLACVAIACLLIQRLDPASYAQVMAAQPGAAATRRAPSA